MTVLKPTPNQIADAEKGYCMVCHASVESYMSWTVRSGFTGHRECVEKHQATLTAEAVVVRPDAKQIVYSKALFEALKTVGCLPPDVYTTGGVTIRIDPRASLAVTADVTLLIPADKLAEALRLAMEAT